MFPRHFHIDLRVCVRLLFRVRPVTLSCIICLSPRYLSESTRTMPHAGRESTTTTLNTGRPNTGREPTMASVNNEWQPIFRGQKPLTPSPKVGQTGGNSVMACC